MGGGNSETRNIGRRNWRKHLTVGGGNIGSTNKREEGTVGGENSGAREQWESEKWEEKKWEQVTAGRGNSEGAQSGRREW
jgi:hypothetical protein